MFDREKFMAYVGEKNGNSYVSGLSRIEKIYEVNVDLEFGKDKCTTLLDRIEHDKQQTDLEPKELKQRSDRVLYLKRYIAFKMGIVQVAPTVQDHSSVLDTNILRFIIKKYKSDFSKIDSQERYKWEGIGWYKSHWDIEAADFTTMLESAFSKMSNLLASSMYYPYKMLIEYAQKDPEAVRSLFRMLYNEELSLEQRYTAFRKEFEKYLVQKKQEIFLCHRDKPQSPVCGFCKRQPNFSPSSLLHKIKMYLHRCIASVL